MLPCSTMAMGIASVFVRPCSTIAYEIASVFCIRASTFCNRHGNSFCFPCSCFCVLRSPQKSFLHSAFTTLAASTFCTHIWTISAVYVHSLAHFRVPHLSPVLYVHSSPHFLLHSMFTSAFSCSHLTLFCVPCSQLVPFPSAFYVHSLSILILRSMFTNFHSAAFAFCTGHLYPFLLSPFTLLHYKRLVLCSQTFTSDAIPPEVTYNKSACTYWSSID